MLNLYDVCVNVIITSGYVICTGVWDKTLQFFNEKMASPLYTMVTSIMREGGKR